MIYRIVHVASGRAYVGQSTNMVGRFSQHRSRLRRGVHTSRHLQNAWTKHGEAAFLFEILEECPPSSLTEREQWHMDQHEQLYNLAPAAGSTLGVMKSPETRAKIATTLKGRTLSTEHRANIAAGGMGKILSAEHRAKIGTANKGKHNTRGFHHTAESKAKMGLAHRGNTYSLGLKRSPETLARMSMSLKAAWTDERREKQSVANTGRPVSAETRAKIGAGNKGKQVSPEARAKISAANKGKKRSDETKAKISASKMGNTHSLGVKRSPETKAKMSESAKAYRARVREAA